MGQIRRIAAVSVSVVSAKAQAVMLAVAALAVGVGVFVLTRKGVAAQAGGSLVRAADGFIGGAVQEAGAVFGIPKTDAQKCAEARARGDTWAASLYCPAGEFIGHLFSGKTEPVDAYTQAGETLWTAWDQEDADAGAALRGFAFAETAGGAVTGMVRR